MDRYEIALIIDTSVSTDAPATVERLKDALTELGMKIERVDELGDRGFSRVANKRKSRGYFTFFYGELESAVADSLKRHFVLDEEVFRIRAIRYSAHQQFPDEPTPYVVPTAGETEPAPEPEAAETA